MNTAKLNIKAKVARMICINLLLIRKPCNISCEFWMFLNEFDTNTSLHESCEK